MNGAPGAPVVEVGGLAGEVELGDFEVAGLGDFEVARGAGDDVNRDVGTLEERGFVGSDKLVHGGFGEGLAHKGNTGTLGGLRVDDTFAGNGGGDEGTVRGAFDLLDGVYGGHAYDGGTVFRDHVDDAVDGGGIDQRADGVVDEDDVVGGRGGQGGEGVRDGVLAGVAPGDDVDFAAEVMLGNEFGETWLL